MNNVDQGNPFALVRASDFSDRQINELWVGIGFDAVNQIIEPRSRVSKIILGSKGSGKTHLLRYHSFTAARLRNSSASGLEVVRKAGYIAPFHRLSGLDSARFELDDNAKRWQQLFGVYLELRLAEHLLEILIDIKNSSKAESAFDDARLIRMLDDALVGTSLKHMKSVEDVKTWVIFVRREIDDAVNQAAFSGEVNFKIPFSIGSLIFKLSNSLGSWCSNLENVPIIYLFDEIENFSPRQQQVVNTLIRYCEGVVTFRVTGRLYSIKTYATISDGEENREGSEFKSTNLDNILRSYARFPDFAKLFVQKRLNANVSSGGNARDVIRGGDVAKYFEELSTDNFYEKAISRWHLERAMPSAIKDFCSALEAAENSKNIRGNVSAIVDLLVDDFPVLLQKLNLLLFCKRMKSTSSALSVASQINKSAKAFCGRSSPKGWYATAYGHYSLDLFAQLCRATKGAPDCVYAGFETLTKMACGNPRNLLILLGRIYALAAFRGLSMSESSPLSMDVQTEGAQIAAKFLFESDSNYGTPSETAKQSITRLARILRTARFALNIPEVSPLAVSLVESQLPKEAFQVYRDALNWSLIFETVEGRPDRNKKEKTNKKIQLNPLLSPYWGLPIGRRGDLSLSPELASAVFSPGSGSDFDVLAKNLSNKWNRPFRRPVHEKSVSQSSLFDEH